HEPPRVVLTRLRHGLRLAHDVLLVQLCLDGICGGADLASVLLVVAAHARDLGQITFDVVLFFQAEDGIRDRNVTGVQTCALPIWRAAEIRVLADVLNEARAGRGASLLLTGGPGLGKTALLDHTHPSAGDFTVLCASGVPDEADFPLAGLQRLLHPIADTVDRLPEPRRAQVRETLTQGTVQDRFVLYTGLLELLTLKAQQRPLLLCVDDADQLDGPSLDALAFISRRISGTSIAVLLTAGRGRHKPMGDRPPGTGESTEQEALVPGIPEHVLAPLEPRAIHDILTVSAPL